MPRRDAYPTQRHAAVAVRRVPLFGEHTVKVLLAVGYTPDDLVALSASRVVARTPRT